MIDILVAQSDFFRLGKTVLNAVTLCNTAGKGYLSERQARLLLQSYPQEVHGRDHPKGFSTTCVPALLLLTAFTAKNKE